MDISKKDDVYSQVYFKLLNFLSFKLRSRKEILDRVDKYLEKIYLPLREKEETRERVVSNLGKDGYLKDSTDKDFSLFYIEGLKKSGRPFNSLKISQFLLKKGVSRDILNELLENLDKDSIYESVLRDAQKKLKNLKAENDYVKKRKLLSYLYRKGYPFDIVTSAVDTLL